MAAKCLIRPTEWNAVVGLLSVAPSGRFSDPMRIAGWRHKCLIRPTGLHAFVGLISAAPSGRFSDPVRIAGWRHKCLIRPTGLHAFVGLIRRSRHQAVRGNQQHLPLRLQPVRQRIERCAAACHRHKRLRAVVGMQVYAAATVGNHIHLIPKL